MATKKAQKENCIYPAKLAAIILAALLVASAALSCGLFFGYHNSSSVTAIAEPATEENNFLVTETESNGIRLTKEVSAGVNSLSGTVQSSTATVNGTTITYESSYSITATLSPSGASGSITWTLSCSKISSISSYVVLSSDTSASGESITVYCLKAFLYQITLTATCGEASADCTLDYVKKPTNVYVYYYARTVEEEESGEYYLNGYSYNHLAFSLNTTWWGYPDVGYGSLLSATIVTEGNYQNYTASYNNLLVYGNDYKISYYYSTAGTVTETITDATFTVTLNSTVATLLGVNTDTYIITDWDINADDIFAAMLGVSSLSAAYKSLIYSAGKIYGTTQNWFTVTATLTGEYLSYSLSNSVYFDYSIYS